MRLKRKEFMYVPLICWGSVCGIHGVCRVGRVLKLNENHSACLYSPPTYLHRVQLHAEESDAELEVAGDDAEEEVEGEDGHGQDAEEWEPLVELFGV